MQSYMLLRFMLCIIFMYYPSNALVAGGRNVCTRATSYTYKCGITWLWRRRRCTGYNTQYFCCTGYLSKDNAHCDYAICAGRVNPDACHKTFSHYIEYRTGIKENNSGGRCVSPEVCGNCNDGFYPSGPYCEMCPVINKCKHQRCTNRYDVSCLYCDGEIKDKVGWRAHTRHQSGLKACQKTCSWRTDSRRCYPGTCANELVGSCECSTGFTGTHCETVTEKPVVLLNELKLYNNMTRVSSPEDPNKTDRKAVVWTRKDVYTDIKMSFTAKSVFNGTLPDSPEYIADFRYGITMGEVTSKFTRVYNVTVYTPHPCDNVTAFANTSSTIDEFMTENGDWKSTIINTNTSSNVITLFCTNFIYHMMCICPYNISLLNFAIIFDPQSSNCTCPSIQLKSTPKILECLSPKKDYSAENASYLCIFEIPTDTYVPPYVKTVIEKHSIHKACTSASESSPVPVNYKCENDQDMSQWPLPFKHNDTVTLTLVTKNGGYIDYVDRDINLQKRASLVGQTFTNEFTVWFDFVKPRHCHLDEAPISACDNDTLSVPDLTTNQSVTFEWHGWYDELAGIEKYHYEVYDLQFDGHNLIEGTKVYNSPFMRSTISQDHFIFPHPGIFSFHFTAYDKAENFRSMRRLSLCDDKSFVSLQQNAFAYVSTASSFTNFTWLTSPVSQINVTWVDRYINIRHHQNHWLESVASHLAIEPELDDNEGSRTVNRSANVRGIVLFKVSTLAELYTKTVFKNFTSTTDLYREGETLNISLEDGDRLNIYIRAYDAFGSFLEDKIHTTQDTSPPIITDMWLTRGNRLNVSVHSLTELTTITAEWKAYDYHSGLHSVTWRLYDNYTGIEVLHGTDWMVAQGDAQNISDCERKYKPYPRGANCYCTRYNGCYHRHFQSNFRLVDDIQQGGILTGKDVTTHDYDFVFEVTVTNNALVNNTHLMKISVDTTPPHSGSVQEGRVGDEEVDYQQDTKIHFHWNGFFDKESGVLFYHYAVYHHCVPCSKFTIHGYKTSSDLQIYETYGTSGSMNVSAEGTYYLTVVAYNRALEPSTPVCSDGVTVDTKPPGVVEVEIQGAMVKRRIVHDDTGNVWIVNSNRKLNPIENASIDCRKKSVFMKDVSLYPIYQHDNGTLITDGDKECSSMNFANVPLTAVLRKSTNLYIQWKPIDTASGIHDYEVGLSTVENSSAPDILPFKSTHQHSHVRIHHPDVPQGTLFYIMVKSISKAAVASLQTIGPVIVDNTPPKVKGNIHLGLANGSLRADWSEDTFIDTEEPYPLQYQIAVGTIEYGTDVQDYKDLQMGNNCSEICTAISLDTNDWILHEQHEYFVSVRVQNTAGLLAVVTSNPVIFETQLPSPGIVFDVSLDSLNTSASDWIGIEDIDFQTNSTTMYVKWTGFSHPRLNITYSISIGTSALLDDVVSRFDVNDKTSSLVTGLNLNELQTYFATVHATTSTGEVSASSDGVTVISRDMGLLGIDIFDGKRCSRQNNNGIQKNHHDQDVRIKCENDTDFQISTNSLECHWTVPANYSHLITSAFWAIERRSPTVRYWWDYRGFMPADTLSSASDHSLVLEPGGIYRVVVQFCASNICYKPLYSDGIAVIPNEPVTGNIIVSKDADDMIHVAVERFYDPDLEKAEESLEAVDLYEWAVVDGWNRGAPLTKWMHLNDKNETHLNLNISSLNEFTSSPCKAISIRGYNKVFVYNSATAEVSGCTKPSADYVRYSNVLDVTGEPLLDEGGNIVKNKGQEISMDTNAAWPTLDIDYTGYSNILSAVWPRLRHQTYTWAAIEVPNMDTLKLYSDNAIKEIFDLCSHPYALKCNTTDLNYINVLFEDEELEHGKRYMICVQGNHTKKANEFWTMNVMNLTACSDGITIDLTPPTAGNVYIGHTKDTMFQTSTSQMVINWNSFLDVEEYKLSSHAFGIQRYMLAIGTHPGGRDVFDFADVGVVNHKAIHGLSLQNGHKYYASIKAFDFTNKFTIVSSEPVIVDTTKPHVNDVTTTVGGRHISSLTRIQSCWEGLFADHESGIVSYFWAVGSAQDTQDILEFTEADGECAASPESRLLKLTDGHAYYITVYARNGAGLVSTVTSPGYIVDTTPPKAGIVCDGRSIVGAKMIDVDYQIDISSVSCQWAGFTDSHTVIHDYAVGIGTHPGNDDLIATHSLGLRHEMQYAFLQLKPGKTYFCTVTACNTADLCTSATSDGLIADNSPPTAGRVIDGIGHDDEEFQYHKSMLSGKWYGFIDPHSQLSHYTVRAGTIPGADNVLKQRNVHLNEELVIPQLHNDLPVGKIIYLTVRAYNKAGLYSEATSNGFLVDDSVPLFTLTPSLSPSAGSIVQRTQVYRSSMKIMWDVMDPESFIERQYISVASHIGGDFNLSSTELNGIVREHVLTDLVLHDGSHYYVKVTSCNGAKVCISSVSDAIFVDSSPPTRGFFAIDTEHSVSAELTRNVSDWMTWSENRLNLVWLGFSDVHSGIKHYVISVGSSYMANDLNKAAQDKVTLEHNMKSMYRNKEDALQLFSLQTHSLSLYRTVYIALHAVNGVGLQSAVIHSQFRLLEGGTMELVRRCTSITCSGHCVCAAQDTNCPSIIPCQDITNRGSHDVSVFDVQDLRFLDKDQDADYIFTDMTLAAHWTEHGPKALWYEWSAGYSQDSYPHGIFDGTNDRTWHICHHPYSIVYTLPRGKVLQPNTKYSVFVKAWYSANSYAIFKSDGVLAVTKSPALTSKKGAMVSERNWNSKKTDIDFVSNRNNLYIDWSNVFVSGLQNVRHYDIYISTFPGGHNVFRGLRESAYIEHHNVTQVIFRAGVKYYSNVVAYGLSGMISAMSSDGFVVDTDQPSKGVVHDGIDSTEADYQSNSSIVGARWHGFTDNINGIYSYSWCVGKSTNKSDCSINRWQNVGLRTSHSMQLSQPVPNGSKVYNKIFAVDAVGHKSEIAVSNGLTMDTTPPVASFKLKLGDNIVLNPSFDESQGSILPYSDLEKESICEISYSFHPVHWLVEGCAVTISASESHGENRYVAFVGSMSQRIYNISTGSEYKIELKTSSLPKAKTSSKEGRLSFLDMSFVFLLKSKTEREETSLWQTHTFYVRAMSPTDILKIESIGVRGGFALDSVEIRKLENEDKFDYHIEVKVQLLPDQHSVFAEWKIEDPESPIINYKWALGTVKGGISIQPFRNLGTQNYGQTNNVTLKHNSNLHVTIIATNAAKLHSVFYSEPIIIDHTPPTLKFINDGTAIGEDVDIQDNSVLSVNWLIVDEETGVKKCAWSIGSKPKEDDIQPFRELQIEVNLASVDLSLSTVSGKILYSTIRCQNNAGLMTTAVTDGVLVTTSGPTIGSAILIFQELSTTEYDARNEHQSLTRAIKTKWTTFEENNLLYQIRLTGPGSTFQETITSLDTNMVRLSATGLSMRQGSYNLTVSAINALGLRSSDDLTAAFHLNTKNTVTCKDAATFEVVSDSHDRTFMTVSWKNTFQYADSNLPVQFFEVSAGTDLGSSDIFQWLETKNNNITFRIPDRMKRKSKFVLVVRAVFVEGLYHTCVNTLYTSSHLQR